MTALLGYAIPFLTALSAFLFALSLIPTKSTLSTQLEELKSRAPANAEPVKLPIIERIVSGERRVELARRFAEAGWYTTTPTKFALRVIAGGCLGAVSALLFWDAFGFPFGWLLPVLALITLCGAYVPFFVLNRASENRKTQIQKALPEFLDMMSSTIQAGQALNAALAYAVDAVPGALAEEVKEALSEIRMGRARADALKAVGERTNHPALRNALRVLIQAERLGANISKLLTDLAADARHQRLMLVEEMAAKLPVKMVFPMVFLMIPAIILIIFGSVAANYFAPQ